MFVNKWLLIEGYFSYEKILLKLMLICCIDIIKLHAKFLNNSLATSSLQTIQI